MAADTQEELAEQQHRELLVALDRISLNLRDLGSRLDELERRQEDARFWLRGMQRAQIAYERRVDAIAEAFSEFVTTIADKLTPPVA